MEFKNRAPTSSSPGPILWPPTISFEVHAEMAKEIDLEKCTFRNFGSSVTLTFMVSIAVSKMGMIKLIFVDNGMKINGQYYHDALLYQQMLPAIKRVAGDTTVFQQDNAPSHHAKDTIKLLQQKTWTSLVLISGH